MKTDQILGSTWKKHDSIVFTDKIHLFQRMLAVVLYKTMFLKMIIVWLISSSQRCIAS